jgi:hypothetical protein
LELEQTASLKIDGVNNELIIAARFIEGNPAMTDHLLSVADCFGEKSLLVFEQDGPKLSAFIFKGKVAVTRVGAREIGDFATHPDEVELPFKKIFDGTAYL